MLELELRKADEKDSKKILKLINELREKMNLPVLKNEEFEMTFRDQLNINNGLYLVAIIEKEIIGFVNINFHWNIFSLEKLALIDEFIVEERYLKEGVADKLMKELSEHCKRLNIKKIEANIGKYETVVNSFYKSHKFKLLGDYYIKLIL